MHSEKLERVKEFLKSNKYSLKLVVPGALIGAGLAYYILKKQPWLPKLRTVHNLDVSRYQGTWYEISRLPTWFERDCVNVRATYTLRDGYIEVYNQAVRDGRNIDIRGRAYADAKNNAKLSVYFVQWLPIAGDYQVIAVDKDYQWAVVGSNNRRTAWVLSRTPTLPEDTLSRLYALLEEQKFDVSRMELTQQKY